LLLWPRCAQQRQLHNPIYIDFATPFKPPSNFLILQQTHRRYTMAGGVCVESCSDGPRAICRLLQVRYAYYRFIYPHTGVRAHLCVRETYKLACTHACTHTHAHTLSHSVCGCVRACLCISGFQGMVLMRWSGDQFTGNPGRPYSLHRYHLSGDALTPL